MIIGRIAPLSAARIAGLIYALIGLLFAILVWVVSLVGLNISGLAGSPFAPFAPGSLMVGGAVAVVMLPIVYGAFGFAMTLIGASIYNVVANLVGGLSVEVRMDPSPDVATR